MSIIYPSQWSALEEAVDQHRELTDTTPTVAVTHIDGRTVCTLHGGGRTASLTLDHAGRALEPVT